jgi:hypothetical protein
MAEDAGDEEKSESRFLDVSEEINIRVLPGSCGEIACFVSVAAAGVSHTVPWHLLPLNHWLDQASGCISTLEIQRGRGVCLLNRVQFDAMQVTMHTILLKHKTLSLQGRACKDQPRSAAHQVRKAGVSPGQ